MHEHSDTADLDAKPHEMDAPSIWTPADLDAACATAPIRSCKPERICK